MPRVKEAIQHYMIQPQEWSDTLAINDVKEESRNTYAYELAPGRTTTIPSRKRQSSDTNNVQPAKQFRVDAVDKSRGRLPTRQEIEIADRMRSGLAQIFPFNHSATLSSRWTKQSISEWARQISPDSAVPEENFEALPSPCYASGSLLSNSPSDTTRWPSRHHVSYSATSTTLTSSVSFAYGDIYSPISSPWRLLREEHFPFVKLWNEGGLSASLLTGLDCLLGEQFFAVSALLKPNLSDIATQKTPNIEVVVALESNPDGSRHIPISDEIRQQIRGTIANRTRELSASTDAFISVHEITASTPWLQDIDEAFGTVFRTGNIPKPLVPRKNSRNYRVRLQRFSPAGHAAIKTLKKRKKNEEILAQKNEAELTENNEFLASNGRIWTYDGFGSGYRA